MTRPRPVPVDTAEEVHLPVRECPRCLIWTQCGRCPDCGEVLGGPPFATNVRPGELDVIPLPRGSHGVSCPRCGLSAPFHRSAECARAAGSGGPTADNGGDDARL